MIGLTSRPPQLETPFAVFNENVITPNDAFFVRYHLADIPYDLDPETFSLEIKGKVDKPLKLSLADLKTLPSVELVAVNQCSGNSRGIQDAEGRRRAAWQRRHGQCSLDRRDAEILARSCRRAGWG